MAQEQDEQKKVLVLSDNIWICVQFQRIISALNLPAVFSFAYSPINKTAPATFKKSGILANPVDVKTQTEYLISNFDVIISAHCKQVFPSRLVQNVKCINIHPGLNPYNRGWFPQVFSILNKMPLGATIHEIDEELDHGPIICQQEVPLYIWDTSLTAYERVQMAEVELLEKWLPNIISGNYNTYIPKTEGNINLKKDFNTLLAIDMDQFQRVGQTIDLLRALTHGGYKNAYFTDPETGKKIFVQITLQRED